MLILSPTGLDALWQLRRQTSYESFWIDAICINQADLAEKGSQVQFMGLIFEAASVVFVSLGPHDNASEHLFKTIQKGPINEQGWFDFVDSLLHEFGNDYLSALCAKFYNLSCRPYWRRLWIAQEFLSARDVVLLCGVDTLHWLRLHGFGREMGTYFQLEYKPRNTTYYNFMGLVLAMRKSASTRGGFTFGSLLENFRQNECSNVLDRIFALNYMVTRYVDAVKPITVDYNLCTIELVRRCVEYMRKQANEAPRTMRTLLERLELGSTDEVIQNLIEERRTGPTGRERTSAGTSSSAQNHAHQFMDAEYTANASCIKLNIPAHDVAPIRVGLDNTVSSSFMHEENWSTLELLKGWKPRFQAAKASTFPGQEPLYIMGISNPIGLISAGVRSGDYLMRLESPAFIEGSFFHCGLVLRHDGAMFELVGQALFLEPNCWSAFRYASPNCRTALVLSLGIDDLIAWGAQGLHEHEGDAEGQTFEIAAKRTSTRPSLSSRSSYAKTGEGWPLMHKDCPCMKKEYNRKYW